MVHCSHQLLEEVSDPLVVAPLLNARKKSVVELPVDLVELGHFEEDRFYLRQSEHRLRRRSRGLQRLHGLEKNEKGGDEKDALEGEHLVLTANGGLQVRISATVCRYRFF